MRVHVTRRGGIAGVRLHAELDTSELDAQTASSVEGALRRLLERPQPASPPQPDRFQYEITVSGCEEPIPVAENDLPAELAPLIELVSRAGTPEHTRPPGER